MNKNMLEIERKFLIKESMIDQIITSCDDCFYLVQGYLTKNELGSVRVRIETNQFVPFDRKAYLMSKIKIDSMSNNETVDEISPENAITLIDNFAISYVSKTRYIKYVNGKKWEIDFFKYPNDELKLAEIELESADEEIILPDWIDKEVTGIPEYYNANM